MRLLVTGASGLLGLNLSLVATARGHDVTGLVHSRSLQGVPFEVQQADLLVPAEALSIIKACQPDAIIHCAAIANVNAAEKMSDLARTLNSEIPGKLAAAASIWDMPFIHISTDAVFDGQRGGYVETDLTNPLSVYARTKLAGEQAVLAANPQALVIRTVFYGWSLSGKRSLAEFFYNKLKTGETIKGFADTYFCPLYVEDLAETLLEMLSAELNGIYHVVSPDSLSKYDFGVRIARIFGFDPELISPARRIDMEQGVRRSLNLVLKSDKVQAALSHALPTVDEGLGKLFQRRQEGYPDLLQSFAG
jgi:dTDP-4-dehydrorhamnose reductase